MDEMMIRGRARQSGTPRPELGALTGGAEYLVPAALFDEEIFERLPDPALEEPAVETPATKKTDKGAK